MAASIKAGIVGGAGYAGGELLRLLLLHPNVELAFVQSRSQAGKPVYAAHPDLLGETELAFCADAAIPVDVLFLCAGHGEAAKFLAENEVPTETKIIDLSQDFRWHEGTSGDTVDASGRSFVYGLPELQREQIQQAQYIANPGCFATGIQLALLPLAKQSLLTSDVHVSGITGSTGAGQSLSATSHFSWRTENVSTYKVMEHQHLREIKRSLLYLQPEGQSDIHFIPYRGPFARGIFITAYLQSGLSLEEAQALYKSYYGGHPFTIISDQNPDLKQVVNTNKCVLYLQKHGSMLVITSLIDNLLKGAAGQAVQNMNLVFGLEETTGLKLKATAF
ncbi:N-acetyl-gamma-glutamyl-phosphate reductase [Pontibacter sp. JH31]|uniref:N-acetyl-gamma-glutamyl-phosphate reductase n=1 Tax=Pontibacter aquaedesilientis TaxID=2766980 RepID=A0ABR7XCR3_9BACT|nr:N-acetyl-gamma-glutamyl-phosphate reductase [Pontibacter aquaedesilientis]MBD1396092.1 N-acetyl-gamma-glutamyl-phosphate reductase [Pontibacter aquaedesilientis]